MTHFDGFLGLTEWRVSHEVSNGSHLGQRSACSLSRWLLCTEVHVNVWVIQIDMLVGQQ